MDNNKGKEETFIDVAIIQIAGQEPYKLVLSPGEFVGTWDDAIAWAADIGGVLPNRYELVLLFAHQPDQFRPELYWSSIQDAVHRDFVWCQNFSHGRQDSCNRHRTLLARAVYRIPANFTQS